MDRNIYKHSLLCIGFTVSLTLLFLSFAYISQELILISMDDHIDRLRMVSTSTSVSSQLYPHHNIVINISTYEGLNFNQMNFGEVPRVSRLPQHYYNTSVGWVVQKRTQEHSGDISLELQMGNESFVTSLVNHMSTGNTMNPVLFSIPYLATQSPWIEKYKKIYLIIHKHEIAYLYLLNQMKKKRHDYFDIFTQPDFYENFNFTQSSFQFINNLVTLNLTNYQSSLKNNLVHYCLGSLSPQKYGRMHQLWVHAINSFRNQNTTKLGLILERGCSYVNQTARIIVNSLQKVDELEQINSLVNTNSSIVEQLPIKAHSPRSQFTEPVLNGLAYLFKNVSDNQDIDFNRSLSILISNSSESRQYVRDLVTANETEIQELKANYSLSEGEFELAQKVLDYADQHMILPSLKDSFVKDQILSDLNNYLLHYYSLLVYNYLNQTYFPPMTKCVSFFEYFIPGLNKSQYDQICDQTYAQQGTKMFAELCFIECTKFIDLTNCNCTIESDLLKRGRPKLLDSIKYFKNWVNLTTPHSVDMSFSCKHYVKECPPFIVAIQQLNTSLLSLLGSQIFEYLNCPVEQPFTSVNKFDPAPIFREIPYMNVLNGFQSPWMHLDVQNWWMLINLFVKQDLVPPLFIKFARNIFFTSFNPFQNYSTQLLDELYKADPFTVGNPCFNYSDIHDFDFFLLNATFADTSTSELTRVNNNTKLQRDVYELSTDFKTCNLSHTQPLFNHGQNVSGSLGYILPLKTRFDSSQFIYNNYLRRVLQYDEFPCPHTVEQHKKKGVERRCYILNTTAIADQYLELGLEDFMNLTHAYRGAYYASILGSCGVEFGECEAAGIQNGPSVDCSYQKYDEDHHARSNWISVDRQTGIVLYSEMNYALWGLGDSHFLKQGPGCYMVPLFDLKEQIIYDHSRAGREWADLSRIKITYQTLYYILGSLAALLLIFLIYQVRVLIKAREARILYAILKKT